MTSIRCAFTLALLLALTPPAAFAATVTVTVGTFEWSQLFFFTDDFKLENISAAAGIAADFTDVSLTLTTDYDGDGSPDASVIDGLQGLSTTLGSVVPGNSLDLSFDPGVLSVSLAFQFAPIGLPELNFAQTFTTPELIFVEYSYEVADPGPEPVPEPASLLLLSAALGSLLLSRRKTGKPRTTY